MKYFLLLITVLGCSLSRSEVSKSISRETDALLLVDSLVAVMELATADSLLESQYDEEKCNESYVGRKLEILSALHNFNGYVDFISSIERCRFEYGITSLQIVFTSNRFGKLGLDIQERYFEYAKEFLVKSDKFDDQNRIQELFVLASFAGQDSVRTSLLIKLESQSSSLDILQNLELDVASLKEVYKSAQN